MLCFVKNRYKDRDMRIHELRHPKSKKLSVKYLVTDSELQNDYELVNNFLKRKKKSTFSF